MKVASREPRRIAPQRPSSSAPQLPRQHYWLPRTIRPTREGWWLIGATLAVGLAATNTGNNLLYLILAMMLSFMAISGVLSEQAMRRVRLQRELPHRLFAGAPGTFGVRLTNGKRRLPSYALHVAEADPSGGPPALRARCCRGRIGPGRTSCATPAKYTRAREGSQVEQERVG